ncbi:methyl-accepting chemotaxis protein [Nitrospirillum iridis]|uniref:Methyl-accepting chemotaxis protein n=1 Tax=Nitrospirillum iridis TaxID=765888 RepID=A0A7X0ED87_9PROT|nr:HAMP domain-containing methyl-accepting chemotaxis protein [Nitrospirillum iridis]MBB6250079.1 methyl-accepting chemotaxis protein [Nitrospirillum iridis]
MRLTPKLLLPVVGMAVIAGVLVIAGQIGLRRTAAISHTLEEAQAVMVQATEVRALSRAIQRDALNTILEPAAAKKPFADRALKRVGEMRALVAALQPRLPADGAMTAFTRDQEAVMREAEAVVKTALAGDDAAAATRFREQVRPREREASTLTDGFIDDQGRTIAALTAEAARVRAQTGQALAWTGALGVAAALAGASILGLRLVVRPLGRLTATTRAIIAGDLDVAVAATDRGDELGDLARALAVFRDTTAAMRRLEAEQAALRRQADQDRKAAQAAVADTFEAQVAGLIADLAASAREMRDTADAMADAAGVTRDRSHAVAGTAVQTSANVQMVATASEQLSATVQEIAQQVDRSRRQAQDAIADCATSAEVVGQLTDSTAKITEVVGMIAGIAAQTNLLALNATIEAARAGEAGKGFAVVATEVKALATQTAQATEDVTDQVRRIQTLGERTAAAIAGMSGAITGMADIALAIASAVEEQTAATREVARGITEAASGAEDMSRDIAQVSAAATTTGSAATQIKGTSGKLAEHADVLTGAVERFLGTVRAA